MPLSDEYLVYRDRKPGMDNPYYGWDPADRRTPVALRDGTKVLTTIIVPLEFFPLDPPDTPFKHPGAMKTQYPDLRHYTVRDYGNRIGVFRLLRAFAKAGVSATFAINADVARRYPTLIERVRADGHEIAAHGVSTAHIHHEGMSEKEERTYIATTSETLPGATTWMSPVRNQSTRTMSLLAQAGFTVCLDWEADMRPIRMQTANGVLVAIPHYNELNDMTLLTTRSQSEDGWKAQITTAAEDHVLRYDTEGAGAFAFTMTPYVLGQPFRVYAVEQVLNALTQMAGLKVVTAREAAMQFDEATP